MKNKKKIILIALLIVFVLVCILLFVLHCLSNNSNEVKQTISLVEHQENLEKNLKSDGYTIDHPNIIVNPYEISPLTALIIFETESEVAPIVTIVGEDEHTTFTHEFEKNTIHYLPIYGLYAGRDNEVIIEVDGVEKSITITTEELPDDFIVPTSV